MPGELAALQVALNNTCLQIDGALDKGDRRAFRVWCQRRAQLLARAERLLLAMATAPTPTR